ncbi:protein GVQW3-like [Monomorium pharaonis]|uniref:protein GVQW3-like n=1 Tax=Monomorium pharaonis TaxID=307658 RepID=UPI0017467DD5|nr:protein GVQW3-like [Monomorium pharaonis]
MTLENPRDNARSIENVFNKHHDLIDSCLSFSYFHHMVSFLLSIEARNLCLFRKMERSEFRAVIKHLYLKGLTPKEIKTVLDEVHGTSAPVFATVYNWVNEFKRGCTSTKDEHRSGRPVEVTTPGMINKIHDMVLSNRRIKVREIVEATGISQGTVFSILHKKLGVKKSRQDGCRVCSQWTGAHLCSFDGQNHEIKVRIITTSTVFTGFGS